jgi:ATP-dependent Lhr-like helicase
MFQYHPDIASVIHSKGWEPLQFQLETASAYHSGYSGILNVPTGSGKTYALFWAVVNDFFNKQNHQQAGLKLLWITPLRALSKEIQKALGTMSDELGLNWKISVRNGDTSAREKAEIFTNPPDVLIITPESLHVLLAKKGYTDFFSDLSCIVVDEWHELLGSKRGVQTELAISRLIHLSKLVRIWGISATIGNMDEAEDVLFGSYSHTRVRVSTSTPKEYIVETVIPDTLDLLPWAGHLGIRLLEKALPIIEQSNSVLIFTNTRSQTEIWYQKLLDVAPHFAGCMAMHHSSLDQEIRLWVEQSLRDGLLKVVVCTASLDLGVDFHPVDTIIQVGSPKGVSRFVQRAGRSGHSPGKTSKIYFIPTHSLELVEGAALREAIKSEIFEDRTPIIRAFDVLLQYLVTLGVGEGFNSNEIYSEIIKTHCYKHILPEEFAELLVILTDGGPTLSAYDEYTRLHKVEDKYYVTNKRQALRHRLNIGTIVSDGMLNVRYLSGKRLGTVEEWLVSRLSPGDTFWFAGRNLELLRMKETDVFVRDSKHKKGVVASWMGGRMPLSARLSGLLRQKLLEGKRRKSSDPELNFLFPLFDLQEDLSIIPSENQLLIEKFHSDDGYHVFVYPFEGRFVHEAVASLIAYRLSRKTPLSISIAMNDYGFELLSDKPIPIEKYQHYQLFSSDGLYNDILRSINAAELAGRSFRDIACISGLVFSGMPGNKKKERHLQSSTRLLFDVLNEHQPDHILIRQSYEEAIQHGLEEDRIRGLFERISSSEIIVKEISRTSPFSFPILADRLRGRVSTEEFESIISKLTVNV